MWWGISPVHADENNDVPATIAAVNVEIGKDGRVTVTEKLTWPRKSVDSGFVTRDLLTLLPYSSEQWRKFSYSNFRLESADRDFVFDVLDDTKNIIVRMQPSPEQESTTPTHSDATETKEVSPEDDVIHATLTYDVEGTLATLVGTESSRNEFFWSPLSPTRHPYTSLTLSLNAARTAQSTNCTILTPASIDLNSLDPQSTNTDDAEEKDADNPPPSCAVKKSGSSLTVKTKNLTAGFGLATRFEFPSGTFESSSAISVYDPDPDSSETMNPEDQEFDPTWTDAIDQELEESSQHIGLIFAGVLALVLTTFIVYHSRRKADLTFDGLERADVDTALSLTHDDPAPKPIKIAKDAVAPLRFIPPATLSIGETGALWALELRWNEATAILIDLASQGFIAVSENPTVRDSDESSPRWSITRITGVGDPAQSYQRILMDRVFGEDENVSVHSLHSRYAPQFLEVLSEVGQAVSAKSLVVQQLDHEVARRAHRKQRTPLGRAYAEQIFGFEQAIKSATASTLERFEVDSYWKLFERYLPYAIIFGCADEWARLFDEFPESFEQPSWFSAPSTPVDNSAPYTWFLNRLREFTH